MRLRISVRLGVIKDMGAAIYRFFTRFHQNNFNQQVAIVQLSDGLADLIFWAKRAK